MRNIRQFGMLTLGMILYHGLIQGHGFGGNTMTRTYHSNPSKPLEGWQSLRQIYDYTLDQYLHAKSYNTFHDTWSYQPIKLAGSSRTNCYMRIRVDDSLINVIECTPSQEFYDADQNCWVPACQLVAGQFLLCNQTNSANQNGKIQIISNTCILEPLNVYTLEIENNHSYLVTFHNILTHNKELTPGFYCALIESFCHSAAAGSSIGSAFGPAGAISGLIIGGILAVGFSCFFENWDRVWYKLKYDINQVLYVVNIIKKQLDQNIQTTSTQKPVENILIKL